MNNEQLNQFIQEIGNTYERGSRKLLLLDMAAVALVLSFMVFVINVL